MKIIGIGAAGNKAVLGVVKALPTVITKNDVLIMNSTTKDFPAELKDRTVLLSNVGGCGKERAIGHDIMKEYLSKQTAREKLNEFFPETESHAVLVTSMGGGTGSGATNLLARFLKDNLDLDVTIIGFKGISEDLREIQNTAEFVQEFKDDLIVQIIDNSKFMDAAGGNKLKAEQMANNEFIKRINILSGKMLVESDQNIDDTDLYKLVTLPGYQQVEYTELKNIKNHEAMEKTIKDMIDNSFSLQTKPTCSTFGVMLNVKPDTLDWFDFTYKQLKEKYGYTDETYPHIQFINDDSVDKIEWMAVIVSGLNLPTEELKDLYEHYKEYAHKINRDQDEFFATVNEFQLGSLNSKTNRGARKRHVKDLESNDFINQNEKKPEQVSNGSFRKRNVKIDAPSANWTEVAENDKF